jgi:hypothetical protein
LAGAFWSGLVFGAPISLTPPITFLDPIPIRCHKGIQTSDTVAEHTQSRNSLDRLQDAADEVGP